MTAPPQKPDPEPIELQTYLFRTLREAVAPLATPELDRILQEWCLTYMSPGQPSKKRVFGRDDGDYDWLKAEVLDLRRLYLALLERKSPSPTGGLKPHRGNTATTTATQSGSRRPFTGNAV